MDVTKDKKGYQIAVWYYGGAKEVLIGYPVEPEMYQVIEFLWPVAKRLMLCINEWIMVQNPIRFPQLRICQRDIRFALGDIDEDKLLDALYDAIQVLNKYKS